MSFSGSENLTELAVAMAKMQGELEVAKKDNVNPHFKSKYADLKSCWDACREPLSNNGLSVIQLPQADGMEVIVETLLLHSSGQFIKSALRMTAAKNTPQAIGSAITYARRYALMSVLGIAGDDDDGNESSFGQQQYRQQPQQGQQQRQQGPAKVTKNQLTRMFAILRESHATQDLLKEHMSRTYGISSSKDLTMQQYKDVIDWITKHPEIPTEGEGVNEKNEVNEVSTPDSEILDEKF